MKLVCLISRGALIFGQILNSRSELIMGRREYFTSDPYHIFSHGAWDRELSRENIWCLSTRGIYHIYPILEMGTTLYTTHDTNIYSVDYYLLPSQMPKEI